MKLTGFKKLSPEKRKQLFMVGLVTAMVLAGLGFGLIKAQFAALAKVNAKKQTVVNRLNEMERMVQRAPITEMELAVTANQLAEMEKKMAGRDVYSWVVTTLRDFKQNYRRVDIPQVGQPVIADNSLLPNFPYRQATLKVAGTAAYQDFGMFLADFENEFPHFRIVNLEIVPASTATERGMLSFQFDLVTLVNPNPS